MADKYKEYSIKTLEDALRVFYDLIINVTSHLIKYEEYSKELEDFICDCLSNKKRYSWS